MPNLTSANPSIDAALTAWGQYGGMVRAIGYPTPNNTTAATLTSGYVSCQRFARPFTIPSVTAALKGYCLTMADIASNVAGQAHLCLEYPLGTITLSGNAFSGAGSMPIKTLLGTSLQTASSLAFLCVTTTGTATTPTITITYTNQDGVAGQTATLILPTTPTLNTAFFINPHLANGDTGIRAVTGISSSVTTGNLVMTVYGCLVLNPMVLESTTAPNGSSEPLVTPTQPMYLCEPGENVNTYRSGAISSADCTAFLAFCPEPV